MGSADIETKSASVRHIDVDDRSAGQRIDNFLKRELKGVPASRIYRILRSGEVRVNSGRVKPAYKLNAGDRVRVPPVRLATRDGVLAPTALIARLEKAVLLEDDDLIALDKPASVAVHGGSGIEHGVIEALRQGRPNAPMLELVHRLDRETSGCLLIAKSRSVLLSLHDMLRAGQVEKHYIALLAGRWQGGKRASRVPLKRSRGEHGNTVRSDDEGKPAASEFEPLQRFHDCTLVRVRIATGRTHQIRVHAAELGYPVAGDERYGDFALNRGFRARGLRRLFLHAKRLRFDLPESGRKYDVQAPLDPQLQQFVDTLSREDAP